MKHYRIYISDMGSYATNAKNLEDLTWHVNSARDHDGLKPVNEDTVRKGIVSVGPQKSSQ